MDVCDVGELCAMRVGSYGGREVVDEADWVQGRDGPKEEGTTWTLGGNM